jgi:hypothetical protein
MDAQVSIFISKPRDGWVFVARRSKKGRRYFLWSRGRATIPSGLDVRIEAGDVPKRIRKLAYNKFWKDGLLIP